MTRITNAILNQIMALWCDINNTVIKLLGNIKWHIDIRSNSKKLDVLIKDKSYLLICNHQSWADIPTLQYIINRKIPAFKFFLKQELIYVPIMGYSWWALDYPFMKRYTKEYLAKYPEKKGQDIATTKKACEKFKEFPVTIINYAEGTRYTQQKHDKQQSQFQYLLKPKSGGINYALSVIESIDHIIDTTIIYPNGKPSISDIFSGSVGKIEVHMNVIPRPEWLGRGDYENDVDYKKRCQDWINNLWQQKDALIAARMHENN